MIGPGEWRATAYNGMTLAPLIPAKAGIQFAYGGHL
jgi:hypothetical protein